MLNLSHVDHLNISAKNLQESIEFYQKLFGFEIREKFDYQGIPGAIIGQDGALWLALYERDEEVDHEKSPIKHLGINVINFGDVERVLKELDIEITYDYQYPESRSLYFLDPNGLEIELSEHFGGLKN